MLFRASRIFKPPNESVAGYVARSCSAGCDDPATGRGSAGPQLDARIMQESQTVPLPGRTAWGVVWKKMPLVAATMSARYGVREPIADP